MSLLAVACSFVHRLLGSFLRVHLRLLAALFIAGLASREFLVISSLAFDGSFVYLSVIEDRRLHGIVTVDNFLAS